MTTPTLIELNREGPGWKKKRTMYSPISTSSVSLSTLSLVLIFIALLITGTSSTLTSLNFVITTLVLHVCAYILSLINLYPHSILVTAVLLLIVLPVLTIAIVMLACDVGLNTTYLNPLNGGDPVFYQHLFWKKKK
jgi:heme/copper-type cytochrome/quinol oxidase subunit 1